MANTFEQLHLYPILPQEFSGLPIFPQLILPILPRILEQLEPGTIHPSMGTILDEIQRLKDPLAGVQFAQFALIDKRRRPIRPEDTTLKFSFTLPSIIDPANWKGRTIRFGKSSHLTTIERPLQQDLKVYSTLPIITVYTEGISFGDLHPDALQLPWLQKIHQEFQQELNSSDRPVERSIISNGPPQSYIMPIPLTQALPISQVIIGSAIVAKAPDTGELYPVPITPNLIRRQKELSVYAPHIVSLQYI